MCLLINRGSHVHKGYGTAIKLNFFLSRVSNGQKRINQIYHTNSNRIRVGIKSMGHK